MAEEFDKPPELEMIHHSLSLRPNLGKPLRPFILCDQISEKEQVLKWARKHELKYNGAQSEFTQMEA